MTMRIVNTGADTIPGPEGRVQPFATFEARSSWLHRNSSPRLKTVEAYDDDLAEMDRKALQQHLKVRRGFSGEDLKAKGSDRDLRRKLSFTDRFEGEPNGEGDD